MTDHTAEPAEVTTATADQAVAHTRMMETRSLECSRARPMCSGCDGAAAWGWGPCLHDCHEEPFDEDHFDHTAEPVPSTPGDDERVSLDDLTDHALFDMNSLTWPAEPLAQGGIVPSSTVIAVEGIPAVDALPPHRLGALGRTLLQDAADRQAERERAAYERGKAEGIAEEQRAVADALIEVDHHLGALSYIDRGGIPYVEREWAFDVVNKAAKQLFGDGWSAILRAAVDRRRAIKTGGGQDG